MSPNSKVLKHATLGDQAETSLRELIARGDLPPGTRINEVALAAELGISRGPLREAIQVLASEGLLEVIRHRGAFVTSVDARSLGDLYELRIALEAHTLRLLGRNQPQLSADALIQVVDDAEKSLDAEHSGYPHEVDFHSTLFRLAGAGLLTSAAQDVQARISLARARSARNPERAREALNEHREIAHALGNGHVTLATELLESHLRASYDSALSALGEREAAAQGKEA